MGFEAESLTVQEDVGSLFIPVIISQPVPEPITVGIVFMDGSATEQSGSQQYLEHFLVRVVSHMK